jgi:His/Glu/Gln/Arg/opine family amino acid ABC transporter permease subunit
MEKILSDLYAAFIQSDRWKIYLEGLGNTLLIAALACVIGIAIGVIVAVLKYYSEGKTNVLWRVIAWLCSAYTTIIRGTPVIVQLLILYTMVCPTSLSACVIGFGINSGAYVCEIIRSGILSVDPGQTEAGRSLGLSQTKTMRLIVMPQAIKNILPALFNEFIALLKETSVAGYIAGKDLTKMADSLRLRTYNSMPLFIAAAIYLALVTLMTLLQKKLERRLARSDRS